MKKPLLFSFFLLAIALFASSLHAQTTGTYVVADNGTRLSSCLDTNITLNDVYTQLGIKDLHDSNEDVSDYRLLELNGSLITQNEITGPFKFSDYSQFFIQKKNTVIGNNGLAIFVNIITPPTALFKKDTLKYVVDKGAKANITEDFFSTAIDFWSSGKDVISLEERILFRDMATTTELPIKQATNWSQLSPGLYRMVYLVSVCEASDIFSDTLFIKVTESLCHNIQIQGGPSFCRDEIADIRSYVYVDGHVATSTELADMTFYNKSNSATTGSVISPSSINMSEFKGAFDFFPKIQIDYQPNITLGTCGVFQYVIDTKVPTPLASSNVFVVHDNYDYQRIVSVENKFYAFNNIFNKNVLQELYLNNFNVYSGTTFHFYTDAAYQNEVTTNDIPAGDYYLLALNPACSDDSAKFTINVADSDFKIIYAGEQNQGNGYYTFTAPSYPGATYDWMQWGGSIVAGLGTNQVTVYYSENASQGVFITCKITLPASSAKISSNGTPTYLYAAIYLKEDANGDKVEITNVATNITSGVSSNFASAYPNPADGVFAIDGDGEFSVKIYNAIGELVLEQENYTPNTAIQLNSKGMHFAQLTKNGKSQTIKVIIK